MLSTDDLASTILEALLTVELIPYNLSILGGIFEISWSANSYGFEVERGAPRTSPADTSNTARCMLAVVLVCRGVAVVEGMYKVLLVVGCVVQYLSVMRECGNVAGGFTKLRVVTVISG